MPTQKLKSLGVNQFGGFTPYGNVTVLRATLETGATGALANGITNANIASGDKVHIQTLPAGMTLEDAIVVVSTAMTAGVTGSLGFEYVDGIDSLEVPQDAAYFGAGLVLNAVGRLRMATTKALVRLPKEAYLTLTTAGAANAKASRLDVMVYGERLGAA